MIFQVLISHYHLTRILKEMPDTPGSLGIAISEAIEAAVTDKTGEIVAEIDNKNMPADQQITPETSVKLYGKVDKEFFPQKIEIDAKLVEVQK